MRDKAELLEGIQHYEHDLRQVKEVLSNTKHHIRWDQLPEKHRFNRLAPTRRQLLDIVRMIAYRAETAMVPWLTDEHTDSPAARTILQGLFKTSADILPEPEHNRLRIRLHRSSRPATDRRIQKLCQRFNETETRYPGTDLTIVCEMVVTELAFPEKGVTLSSAK